MTEKFQSTPDVRTLEQLNDWLDDGLGAWLCSIVAISGSSPRPLGALFALSADGRRAGSLSGGCIEEALVEELPGLGLGRPRLFTYGVSAEDNSRLGLPCGGTLEVLVEPVESGGGVHHQLPGLLEQFVGGSRLRVTVELATGNWHLQPASAAEKPLLALERWQQVLGPQYQLLLVGAGELARCTSQVAQLLGYRVLLCDPRRDMLDQYCLPGVEALCCMPDDAVRQWADNPYSAVATLSHDPRIDDMALMEALKCRAFYIGALGSQRTNDSRRKRLALLDLSCAEIARLHGPMGIAIGSKTPAEIAVSLMAHITRVRHQ